MTVAPTTLSVVIVTYNRNQVLVDTIRHLLPQAAQCPGFGEILIVDQTVTHEQATEAALQNWHRQGVIRWIRLAEPDLTGAMNRGLLAATSELVLYVDDDIIPFPNLLNNHIKAHQAGRNVAAVVGQVLQPGEQAQDLPYSPKGSALWRYMDFPFRSVRGCFVENAMAGNLSVLRKDALAVGGFDENYRPPVASRFESEFAKRLVAQGYRIWFEPTAAIHHLAASSGGTRSQGSHLNSPSPRYGVGDYYFAMRHGRGLDVWYYCLRRFFREVRTRFHLRHPWYIPIKLLGEARAIMAALVLIKKGPKLLPSPGTGRSGAKGGILS